jgi:hypothetical protein
MNIRAYTHDDKVAVDKIHEANNLPDVCRPDTDNPLFVLGQVAELKGKVAMAVNVKLQGELFLTLDHSAGTPEELWNTLQAISKSICDAAYVRGLDQVSAWLPPEMDESFGKRMLEMGYVKSPFVCYTRNLE